MFLAKTVYSPKVILNLKTLKLNHEIKIHQTNCNVCLFMNSLKLCDEWMSDVNAENQNCNVLIILDSSHKMDLSTM